MTDFLVTHFIKDYERTEDIGVRASYGILSGIVGIICNIILFAVKFTIGFLMHSVSVTADGFNNLSDAGSSIISLIGVKMASKPADEDHPFGHGRIEYIAALVIAFLVLQVGFSFFKESLGKIFNPEILAFQPILVLILILSILMKLWLRAFNMKLGTRIRSKVMLAAATDALGDVFTTSVTVLSILVFHFLHVNVDGYVGILVALIVMKAGIDIAKDTLEPLIGAPVEKEFYQQITDMVESYDGIVGSHDLIVHNYGPNRSIASIHAEVPQDTDILESHEIIDRIEKEVSAALGIVLVIHMDPVETRDQRILDIRDKITGVITDIDSRLSIHDFRFVDGKQQINLIFDLVVPHKYGSHRQEELRREISHQISLLDKRYQCVITIEKSFVSEN